LSKEHLGKPEPEERIDVDKTDKSFWLLRKAEDAEGTSYFMKA
jgi:hypothetical protein